MKNKKFLVLLPALVLALGAVASCGKPSTPSTPSSEAEVAVTGVTLNKGSLLLEEEQEETLTATVAPDNASNTRVTWESNNEQVATVSAQGKVRALKKGTATITVKSVADPTKTATCDVTVTRKSVLVAADEPDITKQFRLGTYQAKLGKQIYFNGEIASGRGNSTESYDDAALVGLEAVDGKEGVYNVKVVNNGDNTIRYLGIQKDIDPSYATKYHLGLSTEVKTEWKWNTQWKTVTVDVDGKTYFPGTYNNYDTMSNCDLTQASGDYIFQFVYKVEECDPTTITLAEAATVRQNEGIQLQAKLGPAGAVGALKWSVTGNEKITINEDTGFVEAANDAEVGSTAKVTAKFGDNVVSNELTVTVAEALNYGTAEAPLTIAQANKVIDAFVSTTNITYHPITLQGYVVSNTAYDEQYENIKEVWLASDDGKVEKAFELYGVQVATEDAASYKEANSLKGKLVTATGYATKYSSTYEITNKDRTGEKNIGKIVKIEAGNRPVTSLQINNDQLLLAGEEVALSCVYLPYGSSTTATLQWSIAGNEKITLDTTNGKVKVANDAQVGATAVVTATLGEITSKFNVRVCEKPASSELIDSATLLGYDGKTNISYASKGEIKDATVGVLSLSYDQIGAYGDGLQFRAKGNSNGTGRIFTKTATAKNILRIAIEVNPAKDPIKNSVDVTVATTVEGLASQAAEQFVAGSTVYAFDSTQGIKAFSISAHQNAAYINSITVYFAA